MAAASLHDLPAELVENVLQDLDFNDIRSLRLTSTKVAERINESSFRNRFGTKHFYATSTEAFQSFADLTRISTLVCRLEHLILMGIASFQAGDRANDDQTELNGTLLGEALHNIRIRSKSRSLRALSLEVVTRVDGKLVSTDRSLRGSLTEPCKPRPARPVWYATEKTFEVAVTALAKSQIPVLELDLFTNAQRCALGSNALDFAFGHDLLPALNSVKSLSMSISSPFPPPKSRVLPPRHAGPITMENSHTWGGRKGKSPSHGSVGDNIALAVSTLAHKDDQNGAKIAAWLNNFPRLESLKIELFDVVDKRDLIPEESGEAFLERIAKAMPGLTKLSLKNLNADTDALLSFFRQHQYLEEVILDPIRLRTPGEVNPVREWHRAHDVWFRKIEVCELSSATEIGPSSFGHAMKEGNPKPEVFFKLGDPEQRRRQFGPPWRPD